MRSVKVAYLWIFLIIQILILTYYLSVDTYNFLYQFNGDEPGYLIFPFSSLPEILNNHRSIGLPLFMHLFNLFFRDFNNWPAFQFIVYIISVLFLFWSLVKSGWNRIFSFLIISLILWDVGIYSMLRLVRSEILCLAFLHFTLGTMLLTLRYHRWRTGLFYALCLFFLYQIRPNVSYIAFLAPFWAVFLASVPGGFNLKKAKQVFLRFSLLSVMPLLLFGALRFAVLGQFGFTTMTGGNFSGHAVHYLDENNISYLTGESRVIGEEILRRKRLFTYPCNLSPFKGEVVPGQSPIETEADCFGANLMMAWLVVIKHQTGAEPFAAPEKNIEAWNYTASLSPFYMEHYHVSTDKILMKFSKDILTLEWKRYLTWIWQGGLYGMKFLFANKLTNFIYIISITLAIIIRLKRKISHSHNENNYSLSQRQVLAFLFVALTNFAFGYLLLLILNFPFDRMFLTLTPLLTPAILMWMMPDRIIS